MPSRAITSQATRERAVASPPLTLCTDFANTRYWRGTELPTETLSDLRAALTWLHEAGVVDAMTVQAINRRKPEAANERLFGGIVAAREALHGLLSASIEAMPEWPSLSGLERWLAAAPARKQLIEHRGQFERHGPFGWRLPAFDGTVRALLAPVAWSAADLLMGGSRGRLRQCDNAQCRWLFIDDSKTANRRWCSMSACGNRAKARRHYLRKTASGG